MLELLSCNNIAPGVGRGASLFLLDMMVVWCDIENCIEMPQQFCPGLQLYAKGERNEVFKPCRRNLILFDFSGHLLLNTLHDKLILPVKHPLSQRIISCETGKFKINVSKLNSMDKFKHIFYSTLITYSTLTIFSTSITLYTLIIHAELV